MGKKNIKPNLNQPVIRPNVAKPALERLTEENLTSSNSTTSMVSPLVDGACATCYCCCSYNGDDAE